MFFIILFLCLFPFCLHFVLLHEALLLLRCLFEKYFQFAKSNLREKFFTYLRHFLTFILLVFIAKSRESAIESTFSPCICVARVSTSPFVYSLKQPINYCCRICTILCMIFKNVCPQKCFVDHYFRNIRILNHYSHFKIVHNK